MRASDMWWVRVAEAPRRADDIAAHAKRHSSALDDSHSDALRRYGRVFLEFLEAAVAARGRAVPLPRSSMTADRSVILSNIAPDAVMKVAAALHLVRLKLARHHPRSATEPFLIKGGANKSRTWLQKSSKVRTCKPLATAMESLCCRDSRCGAVTSDRGRIVLALCVSGPMPGREELDRS